MDKLAAGFNTSEIRVWGISDAVLMRPTFSEPTVKLACDLPSTSNYIDDSNNR